MSQTTKLHKLIRNVTEWTDDLLSNVEDYLDANCTVREIEQLCELADRAYVVPSNGRSDKRDLLFNLLPLVTPGELLAAWDQVLTERSDRQAQRMAERADLEKPHTDTTLAQVLRLLSPLEIAALYYGHERLLHDIQELQFGEKVPRGLRARVHDAHLYRMRLDGGLKWLASEDSGKARAVATHLAELRDSQAQLAASWITRLLEPPVDTHHNNL
jgi:hypothetical protein